MQASFFLSLIGWNLDVDGWSFNGMPESKAKYMRDHYSKLGYKIGWDEEYWKAESARDQGCSIEDIEKPYKGDQITKGGGL